MSKTFCFFWGQKNPNAYLSQWYKSKCTIDDIEFSTAEQYMMFKKAELFNAEEIKHKVLATTNPKCVKRLGRQIKNFKEDVWKAHRELIIYNGNIAKFSQNKNLLSKLLNTGDSILAEASPFDKIYGIGLRYTHKDAKTPEKWKGENLLGKCLMNVRNTLKNST